MRFSFVSSFCRSFKYIRDFFEDAFALIRVVAPHGRNEARAEMLFEDRRADPIERSLDGLDLTDDIDTVGPFINHPFDAPDMPLGIL